MSNHHVIRMGLVSGLLFAVVSLGGQEPNTASPTLDKVKSSQPAGVPKKNGDSDVTRELFSGKVVLLPDALKKRGIKSNSEMKDQVVLETVNGELLPIISDWRGRAFFQDERLRNRQVDLIARKPPGVPYLQVLMLFTFDEQGERQYTDYWCDICSIPMYEIKDCDCCQGPVRLRYQQQPLPEYVKPKKN